MGKVVLVLAGGGSKGSFQFGAIKYIETVVKRERPEFDYSIIAGVSVGTLNGVMLGMRKYGEMERLWNTVTDGQVYTGKLNILALVRILFGKKSALGNGPLKKLIDRLVDLPAISGYDVRIGSVSLLSGEYRSFRHTQFSGNEDFRRAVLSSTSIPVIWEPVKGFDYRDGGAVSRFSAVVDGGVRNLSPLGDVLEDNPDMVIIINCSRIGLNLAPDPKADRNILYIAKRSLLDIAIDEIFNNDIKEYLLINDMVRQAEAQGIVLRKPDGSPYKYYRTVMIEPEGDLGDSLDFSQPLMQRRIAHGYERGREAFGQFQWP